jgi:hypothetical protein
MWNMREITVKRLGWLCVVLFSVGWLSGCTARVSTGSSAVKQAASPPAAQQNGDVVEAQPEWFGCKVDTDCTVEAGLCGRPQSVNRNFVVPFQQYRERMEQVIRCMPNTGNATKETATCLNRRCALKSEVKESRQSSNNAGK